MRLPPSLTLPRKGGGNNLTPSPLTGEGGGGGDPHVRPLASRTSAFFLLLVALALGACSPEAGRTRSGGPGADIGNRPDPRVQPLPELHSVMDPGFKTPRVGLGITK